MKIAIIGTRGYPSYYGGFETAVRMLAPYLAERGWSVKVYGRSPVESGIKFVGTNGGHIDSIVTRGFETKSLSTLSYGFFASMHAIKLRPGVALIMNVANGYFLPILKIFGIRTIVNVDGLEWRRAKWGLFAKTIFRLGAKFTAVFADDLVFDSKEIERVWFEDFGRKGHYIPYGGTGPSEKIDSSHKDQNSVLLVARFVPENTILPFLEAAEALSSEFVVRIVGSSGYGGEIEERVRKLHAEEKVEWFGHVKDDNLLDQLWTDTAVYFHGHSVGGTNPALVQAMSLGACVVALDTVFNREVLGAAGIFVDADATSIESAIRSLLYNQDERIRLSEAAATRASQYFTWELVNQEYERAISSLSSNESNSKK